MKTDQNRLDRNKIQEALAVVHSREKKVGRDKAVEEQKEALSPHEYQILCRATNTTI
ncbi:MAG: hypothetical protein ACTS8S_06260 [Giesbergeria sp.]|jgi:hypothetical protein